MLRSNWANISCWRSWAKGAWAPSTRPGTPSSIAIVALKILPKAREDDAEAVARFEREMEASGATGPSQYRRHP